MSINQKINHFPNNYELTRKDYMYKNFRKFKKELIKEGQIEEAKKFDFYPLTFYMPNEYLMFISEYLKDQDRNQDKDQLWIMKPACKAQGKGIFIVTSIEQIQKWKASLKGGIENLVNELYVCQKYIMNPLLIGGRKFDMRIYCIVTKYNPLLIWLYRTGFARFTHARYTNKVKEIENNYIHLTNVAVQKTCEEYNKTTGGKWDLRRLKIFLYSKYEKETVDCLFDRIEDIIIRSIKSVRKVIVNDRHCFELYGYDILVNSQMQPVLLEINANSSLTSNTVEDNRMKVDMLDDMLSVIDMEKVMTGEERQVGGFDLIYKEGEIEGEEGKSKLGCFNNREFQLKRLAKQRYFKMKEMRRMS